MEREQVYLSTMDENAHKLAKQYGLGLELTEFSIPWNLDEKLTDTMECLQKKLPCTHRFLLHGPYSELFPCAIDPMIRQVTEYRFRQTMQMAKEYHASKVVFHGGYNERLYYPIWYQEQSIEFWKTIEIPENMTICLENVLEPNPELLGDIIRQADRPQLRMCLDLGHVNAYSAVPAEQWIRSCGDLISHFHIHNNDGTGDTHSQLYEGTLPMESLLEMAREYCPEATYTLELSEGELSIRWLIDREIMEEV